MGRAHGKPSAPMPRSGLVLPPSRSALGTNVLEGAWTSHPVGRAEACKVKICVLHRRKSALSPCFRMLPHRVSPEQKIQAGAIGPKAPRYHGWKQRSFLERDANGIRSDNARSTSAIEGSLRISSGQRGCGSDWESSQGSLDRLLLPCRRAPAGSACRQVIPLQVRHGQE